MIDLSFIYLLSYCVFPFSSSPDDLDGVCYLFPLFIPRLSLHQLPCVVWSDMGDEDEDEPFSIFLGLLCVALFN